MKRELPQGYSVRFRHERPIILSGGPEGKMDAMKGGRTLSPKGGSTTALVYNEDGELMAKGVAHCHPGDNFSKGVGRAIAMDRALFALEQIESGEGDPLDDPPHIQTRPYPGIVMSSEDAVLLTVGLEIITKGFEVLADVLKKTKVRG